MYLRIAVLFNNEVREHRINVLWSHDSFAPPSNLVNILRDPVEVAWVGCVHFVRFWQDSPKLVPHQKRNLVAVRLGKLIICHIDIRAQEIKILIDVKVRNPLGHTSRLVEAMILHGALQNEVLHLGDLAKVKGNNCNLVFLNECVQCLLNPRSILILNINQQLIKPRCQMVLCPWYQVLCCCEGPSVNHCADSRIHVRFYKTCITYRNSVPIIHPFAIVFGSQVETRRRGTAQR
mmetsp:Transcript_9504/g.25938  ORF Transcript_9504/g.25938 Transcript_9504/m.25938 type:complete len:234 (+) Transcript_9504:296-997(+)